MTEGRGGSMPDSYPSKNFQVNGKGDGNRPETIRERRTRPRETRPIPGIPGNFH